MHCCCYTRVLYIRVHRPLNMYCVAFDKIIGNNASLVDHYSIASKNVMSCIAAKIALAARKVTAAETARVTGRLMQACRLVLQRTAT